MTATTVFLALKQGVSNVIKTTVSPATVTVANSVTIALPTTTTTAQGGSKKRPRYRGWLVEWEGVDYIFPSLKALQAFLKEKEDQQATLVETKIPTPKKQKTIINVPTIYLDGKPVNDVKIGNITLEQAIVFGTPINKFEIEAAKLVQELLEEEEILYLYHH